MTKEHVTFTTENGLRTERHETTVKDDGSSTTRTFEIETRRNLLPDTDSWVRTEHHDASGNVTVTTKR